MFAGIAVLLFARAAVDLPGGRALTVGMIAAGLALFGLAAAFKQKWTLTYKGHELRFENNPFRGEKLFIDNTNADKGQIGFRSEIRGMIPGGDSAGDTIIVRTDAGLFTFRCRISALEAEAPDAVPPAVSDEQLLAEVRRRGLTNRD